MRKHQYKSYRLESQNADLLLGESKIIFIYGPSAMSYVAFTMLSIVPIVFLVRSIYEEVFVMTPIALLLLLLCSLFIIKSRHLTLNGETGKLTREKYYWRTLLVSKETDSFSKQDIKLQMHQERVFSEDYDYRVHSMMLLTLKDQEIARVTTKKACHALVEFLMVWKEEVNYTVVEEQPTKTLRLDT